jgi:hypothetical protein
MGIIVECAQEGVQNRNTGAKEQCLEGVVIRHALASDEQEFATVEAAKTLANWKADIASKDIIPLYEIEELAVADTEDTFFEGREKRYKTASGKKIRTFNCFLGLCSHNALKSYNGKKMRIYEFTDAQEIKAISPDGSKVKGQLVTIEVGKRVDAMPDKPAHTPVTLTYADFNEFENDGAILKPTWSQIELNGIFDVEISIVSASATSVKFTVDAGCAGDIVTSLENADLTFKKPDGTPVTHSFVAADANGVYEFTGTGFATGDLVGLNGVVSQPEADYEAIAAKAITVS